MPKESSGTVIPGVQCKSDKMGSRRVTAEVRPCCSLDGRVGLCVDVDGACGRWTSGLLQRVLGRGSVVMRVDGPYGEFQDHPEWTHYQTLVIVAGGIGVQLPALQASPESDASDTSVQQRMPAAC